MTAVAKVLSGANSRPILRHRAGRVSAVIIERPGLERQFFLTASQGDVP